MRELQSGLWWWEAVHPDWTAEDDAAGRDWGPEASSYAVDDGQRLLLIDPTTPPAPILDVGACPPSSSPTWSLPPSTRLSVRRRTCAVVLRRDGRRAWAPLQFLAARRQSRPQRSRIASTTRSS